MTKEEIQKRIVTRQRLVDIIDQKEKNPDNPDVEADLRAAEREFNLAHTNR